MAELIMSDFITPCGHCQGRGVWTSYRRRTKQPYENSCAQCGKSGWDVPPCVLCKQVEACMEIPESAEYCETFGDYLDHGTPKVCVDMLETIKWMHGSVMAYIKKYPRMQLNIISKDDPYYNAVMLQVTR